MKTLSHHLKTFIRAIRLFHNYIDFLLDYYGLLKKDYELRFKNGLKLTIRPKLSRNYVSDVDIIDEVFLNNQYRLNRQVRGCVVDIGAHIGIFTCLVAQSHNTQVFAFEPMPENYHQLKRNIDLNKLPNVQAFQLAVSGSGKPLRLYINGKNTGSHSVFKDRNQRRIIVNSISIEDIFVYNELNQIDLLKLDCEGAEYDILFRTPPAFLKRISTILMELHVTPESENRYRKDEFLAHLRKAGFNLQELKEIYYPDEGRFWIIKAERVD